MNKCIFCKREINNKGSLKSHEIQCTKNPNRVIRKRSKKAGAQKGCVPWNKGKKLSELLEDGIISKESFENSIRTSTENGKKSTGKCLDLEKENIRRLKISEYAKKHNGGYRKGSGRGKFGKYCGIWCDSSWELAFLIYNIENGFDIKRCSLIFNYEYENKEYKYYPDFIVDGKIYEIKGFYSEKTYAKLSSVKDLIVIDKHSIGMYLSYVYEKYGNNFISLYE